MRRTFSTSSSLLSKSRKRSIVMKSRRPQKARKMMTMTMMTHPMEKTMRSRKPLRTKLRRLKSARWKKLMVASKTS